MRLWLIGGRFRHSLLRTLQFLTALFPSSAQLPDAVTIMKGGSEGDPAATQLPLQQVPGS